MGAILRRVLVAIILTMMAFTVSAAQLTTQSYVLDIVRKTVTITDGTILGSAVVSIYDNSNGFMLYQAGNTALGGTPSTAPIYTLQVSADGTNWQSTATTFTPTAAGFFSAIAVNPFAKFARLIVSTASSGGTPYGVSWLMISGTN